MLRQLKILTKLELINLYGLNTFRFGQDPKIKRKAKLMLGVWIWLLTVIFLYVGGFSYGMITLEMGDIVPAYLFTMVSLAIFFFGIFKAGSVIFAKNGLDLLWSMPLKPNALVCSRFIRMYVENLGITLAILLPGFTVYVLFAKPGAAFVLLLIPAALAAPLLPMAAATLVGALITAAASRMKHKGLISSVLTIALVLTIMLGSGRLTTLEGELTPEMLQSLSATILPFLERLYPPAVWVGQAVIHNDLHLYLLYLGISLAGIIVVATLISRRFYVICQRLHATSARHDFSFDAPDGTSTNLISKNKNTVLTSLIKKEFKRYFASSVYVTNTIIGPIMGTIMAGSLLFVDIESILGLLPFTPRLWALAPFFLTAVFCLMTPVSVSVSMEGKNWWILKSLPLSTQTILNAKMLMTLLLQAPFYLISQILLFLAFQPGLAEMLLMTVTSALLMVFCCVLGLTANLHFLVLDWDNEVTVVKQSAATAIGGMGGSLLTILLAIPVALVPESFTSAVLFLICVLAVAATVLFYRHNQRITLP